MARKDIITTGDTLPIFLVDHVDGPVQQVPSRLSKAAMSIIVAIGIGVAIALWVVGPEKISAEVNASLIDVPFLKRDADQAALAPQTAASDPQVLKSTASETPTRDEIPAAVDVVDRSQTEISDAQSGALLKQFQTWADEKDAQAARAQAVQPVLEIAQASRNDRASQSDRGPVWAIQKHQRPRPVQNAPAQVRRPGPAIGGRPRPPHGSVPSVSLVHAIARITRCLRPSPSPNFCRTGAAERNRNDKHDQAHGRN
jgi:hypothetical protein